MHECFLNKRKEDNLLTAAITSLSSLSIGEHNNFGVHTYIILCGFDSAEQCFIMVLAKFKTSDPGLEKTGSHNAWDAQLTTTW
jgi:hypothetical protein